MLHEYIFYDAEVGPLHQIKMLWRCENHADRENRRDRLYADADWLAFIPKTATYIETMENRIIKPAFFLPLQ